MRTSTILTVSLIALSACSDDSGSTPDDLGLPPDATPGDLGVDEDAASAHEPWLDDLVVAGVRVPLTPSFAAMTTRYSVIAEETPDDVMVTATADPALSITIDGTDATNGEALTLDTEPGAEIPIIVSNGEGDSRTYTVLYMPDDFPELEVTVNEPEAATEPIFVGLRGRSYFLALLNNDGVPLFWQQMPDQIYDFKRHPGGEYSYCLRTGGEAYSEHVILDESFEEVERLQTVDLVHTDVHEFHILPDGDRILMAYEPMVRDLTAFGGGPADTVEDSVVQQVTPEGSVVFQWNSWDDLPYDESLRGSSEYAHVNSVSVTPDGDWLLSARGHSAVVKIDRETGDELWQLGGIGGDFTFVDDPFGNLCGQHTAFELAGDRILLFDNGQACYPDVPARGEHTRVVEYELDHTAMTATLVWSYDREGAYTRSQGSSQRLANGNTFIGWGRGPDQLATEVDSEGNVVFEIEAHDQDGISISYRAWRFATE